MSHAATGATVVNRATDVAIAIHSTAIPAKAAPMACWRKKIQDHARLRASCAAKIAIAQERNGEGAACHTRQTAIAISA